MQSLSVGIGAPWETQCSRDLAAALQATATAESDVLLSPVTMPGFGGHDAADFAVTMPRISQSRWAGFRGHDRADYAPTASPERGGVGTRGSLARRRRERSRQVAAARRAAHAGAGSRDASRAGSGGKRGGAGYQLWQGALRPLCLDAALDDLDAGVLRAVVPDIASLLGRAVQDPPAVDPQNAQMRLLLAVERLLLLQREPLLLLLEDLHWADPASLAALQHLVHLVARHQLLVVGSYRNDDRPTLSDELSGTHLLSLRRFSPSEAVMLSTLMLGEVGQRPEVVTLLTRETEGNVSSTHLGSTVGVL